MTSQDQDPILPINVFECSSQQPDHPPDQVTEGNPLARGWLSAPNAPTPQHVAVRLRDGECQLSSIQFVSHETFVPEYVEVYTSVKNPPEWQHLGRVKMGAAIANRSRERKTFKFKIPALFVKFQLTQALPVPENVNGQVGLAAVVIRGQPAQKKQQPPQQAQSAGQRIMSAGSEARQKQAQPYIENAERLKGEMQVQKQKAIADARYMDAERYKTAFMKLDQLANALQQLEWKKAAAIGREDYVIAHNMKESIDQIQNLLSKPVSELVYILNNEEPPKAQVQANPAPIQQQHPAAVPSQNPNPGAPHSAQPQANQVPRAQPAGNPADMVNAVPVVRKQDDAVHVDDRAVVANTDNAAYALTDEEVAQMERERKEKARQKMIEKGLVGGPKSGKSGGKQVQNNSQDDVPAAGRQSQQAQKQNHSSPAQRHGQQRSNPNRPYDQATAFKELADKWTKSEGKPQPLTAAQERAPENVVFQANGIDQLVLELLCSKNVDHCNSGIEFLELAVKHNWKLYEVGIAAVNLVGQNTNASLLQNCTKLMCYTYLALLHKHNADGQGSQASWTQVFDIDFDFVDSSDPRLVQQKDNAVCLAEMMICMKPGLSGQKVDVSALLMQEIMVRKQAYIQFQNDVMALIQQQVIRFTNQQKKVKTMAINQVATLAKFVGFPFQLFLQNFIKKSVIDKVSQLQSKDWILSNNKYFSIIEARGMALVAILEEQPDNVNTQTMPVLLEFINWVFAAATKSEFRQSLIKLLTLIYETDEGFERAIDAANTLVGKSGQALLKAILKAFEHSDQLRGGCRVRYSQDAAAGPAGRIINISGQKNVGMQEQRAGHGLKCEFCFFEPHQNLAYGPALDALYDHVARDCPCCGVCPSCHLVLEVPMLPSHIVNECASIANYQYKLVECKCCNQALDERGASAHQRECQFDASNGMMCPLCGVQIPNGEELEHYDPNVAGCSANPRTAENLKKIVSDKLNV